MSLSVYLASRPADVPVTFDAAKVQLAELKPLDFSVGIVLSGVRLTCRAMAADDLAPVAAAPGPRRRPEGLVVNARSSTRGRRPGANPADVLEGVSRSVELGPAYRAGTRQLN